MTSQVGLIIGDLAVAVCNKPRSPKIFTQGILHRSLSVILILRNLFRQGKSMRDITLNSQDMVLFKSARNVK